MRRCQANLPNRCRRQIDRIAHRVFDGEQWMDREGCAATTGNTYCGNLLWQSGLTLLAPKTLAAPLPSMRSVIANVARTILSARFRNGLWERMEDE